jgi:excisionase family DNA binding protein
LPDVRAPAAVVGVHDEPTSHPQEQRHQPLLTADDIAAWLAVPRSSVYEYARRARRPLPAVRIGRHLRFLRSDVADWIAAQRDAVEPPPPPRVRAVPPITAGWRTGTPR